MAKQALVTGGTGGIGGAISRRFAQAGYDVLATGISDEEIEKFQSQLDQSIASRIRCEVLDVRSNDEVVCLAQQFSTLDVLVNGAGVILRGGEEFDPERYAEVLDINLNGAMRVATSFHGALATAGGSIVNVASMLSYFGSGYVPGYSSSKGGIVQLTKSLAIAWAPDGVRVNAVAPGWIDTPLTTALRDDESRNAEILERTPMRRWGGPDELAGVFEFLASKDASFITGAVIPVDGGYSAA